MLIVLIVDDEFNLFVEFVVCFGMLWFELEIVGMLCNGVDVFVEFNVKCLDFVFFDIWMFGIDGLKIVSFVLYVYVVFVMFYDEYVV